MNTTRQRYIAEKVVTFFTITLLLGIIAASWLPQPCSYVHKFLMGCPATRTQVLTAHQQELARVPHQSITTQQALVSAKAEDNRSDTGISFEYHSDDPSLEAYVQVLEGGSYHTVGVIAHPLLKGLTWQSLHTEDNYQILQRTPTYSLVDDIKAHLAPETQIAADQAAAEHFGLLPGHYQPLEGLKSLDPITQLFTSYSSQQPDGSWTRYETSADLSKADVNSSGAISVSIQLPNQTQTYPFLLGTVHIDYHKNDRPENKND